MTQPDGPGITVDDPDEVRTRLSDLVEAANALPDWEPIYDFRGWWVNGDFAAESLNFFYEQLQTAATNLADSRTILVRGLAGWGLDDQTSLVGRMWDTILELVAIDETLADDLAHYGKRTSLSPTPQRPRATKPRETFDNRPDRLPGSLRQPVGSHDDEHKDVLRSMVALGRCAWPVLPLMDLGLAHVGVALDALIADPGWSGESADAAVERLREFRTDVDRLRDKVADYQEVIDGTQPIWEAAEAEVRRQAPAAGTGTPDGRASFRQLNLRVKPPLEALLPKLRGGRLSDYETGMGGLGTGLGGGMGEDPGAGPTVKGPDLGDGVDFPGWDADGAGIGGMGGGLGGGAGLAVDSGAGAVGTGLGGAPLGAAGAAGAAAGAASGAGAGLGAGAAGFGGMGMMGGGGMGGGEDEEGELLPGREAPTLEEDEEDAPRSSGAAAGGRDRSPAA